MKLKINTIDYEVDKFFNNMPLLWLLRDIIELKGTKYGCGTGACGACVVLINDEPVNSCVFPSGFAVGKNITTIEGLSLNNSHPLQKSWEEIQVPQCGYCQSGQILTALALLKNNPNPDDDDVKKAMSGVICRCGTYPRIIEAIKLASRKMRE